MEQSECFTVSRSSTVAQGWEQLEQAPFLLQSYDSQNGSVRLFNHALMIDEWYTHGLLEKEKGKSILGKGTTYVKNLWLKEVGSHEARGENASVVRNLKTRHRGQREKWGSKIGRCWVMQTLGTMPVILFFILRVLRAISRREKWR